MLKSVKSLLLFLGVIVVFSGCEKELKNNNVKSKVTVIVPVYSQKVSLVLPSKEWKAAFESNKRNAYRIEFISKEDNSRDWEKLISIQGFRDLLRNKSDKEKLDILMKFSFLLQTKFQEICPKDKFVFDLLDRPAENYIYIDALIGCTALSIKAEEVDVAKGEIGYYRFIAGEKDLYLIHKAVRGEEKEIMQRLNKLNAKEFILSITPIRLCVKDNNPVECK